MLKHIVLVCIGVVSKPVEPTTVVPHDTKAMPDRLVRGFENSQTTTPTTLVILATQSYSACRAVHF
jgi:hypothetical protein